jgi:hypothetical protein
MTYIPNIENTQIYSDDENSKADELSQKMHIFVTKKNKKNKKKIYLGIREKTSHLSYFFYFEEYFVHCLIFLVP